MQVQEHVFNQKVLDLMKTLNDRELYVYLLIVHKTQVFKCHMETLKVGQTSTTYELDLKKVFNSLIQKGLTTEMGDLYVFQENFEDKKVVLDWDFNYLGVMLKELKIREIYLHFWTTVKQQNGEFSLSKEERNFLASAYRMSFPFINRMKLKEAEIGLVEKGYLRSVKKDKGYFHYVV